MALVVSISYEGSTSKKKLSVLKNTWKDRKNMEKFLLNKCNYAVFSGENICKEDFINICKKLAEYEYCEPCTRLVVFFAGHGDDKVMVFQNGGQFSVNDMMEIFTQSTALRKMVRMFFIDACCGDRLDSGYRNRSAKASMIDKESSKQYCEFNMLLAYSTTRKYVSTEDSTGGKWTSNLLENLEENPNEDLLGIFAKVNKALMCHKSFIEGHKPHYQIGEYTSTLAEKVYLKGEVQVDERLDPLLHKLASKMKFDNQVRSTACSGAFGYLRHGRGWSAWYVRPRARGPRAQGLGVCISGRPRVPMLQMPCGTFPHISIVVFN